MLHHVAVSLFPHGIETLQHRLFLFEGNRLTLSTRPMQVVGKMQTSRLVWERMEQERL